jgi:hypothetical protein
MAFRVPQTWDNNIVHSTNRTLMHRISGYCNNRVDSILGNLGSDLKTKHYRLCLGIYFFSVFFGSERNG